MSTSIDSTSNLRAQWLGHPRGLAILFNAELWERFSYYGMRALLVLYLVNALGRSDPQAYALYAVYGAVVYAFGVLGGYAAQRFLGELRAIVVGGALMAAGHLVMALPIDAGLYWALALLCVGNGLFKPNVSSSVGALYREGDPRKPAGYYLFYMGINIGATLAPIACAAVSERFGWHYGFGLAGIGMALGLVVVVKGRRLILPVDREHAGRFVRPLSARAALGLVGALAIAVPLCALLMWKDAWGHLAIELATVAAVAGLLVMAVRVDRPARHKLLALLVLMVFHTAFWGAFEQIGSSLTVLAERFVDREVMGATIPASALVAVNGALIIALTPAVSWGWRRLSARGLEPSVPAKFGLGLVLLGLGYGALCLGIDRGLSNGEVALGWVLLLYLLVTLGELCLSPVGLAMVSDLSPKGATSFCMGAWFLTYANGHLVSGWIAGLTAAPGVSSGEALLPYFDTFAHVGGVAVALGVALLWLLRGFVQRLIESGDA